MAQVMFVMMTMTGMGLILDKDDNCPHNSEIGSTDFRAIQPINLCVNESCGVEPKWEFRDEGKEIWQGLNSRAAIAIGKARLSAVDFSGKKIEISAQVTYKFIFY